MAIMTALLIFFVTGAFTALVMNVGHIMSTRNQLQNAVDAAALAGAMQLAGTAEFLEQSHAVAQDYGDRHLTDIIPVSLDLNDTNDPAGDIVHGVWDFDNPDRATAFTPADDSTPPVDVNAVLVRYGRQASRGNPLQVIFSVFLGAEEASVGAEAVAVGGGPCQGCSFPFAFAECIVVDENGELDCTDEYVFTSATEDNIGFTNLDPGNRSVNTAGVIDLLQAGCAHVQVGDAVGIGNGNNLTPHMLDYILPFVGQDITVPIVDLGACPVQFNGLAEIAGFATFRITAATRPPIAATSIHIVPVCEERPPEDVVGGCGDVFNSRARYTRLVR